MAESNADVLIVGGGVAGLSLAILCARDGLKTVVLEKGCYPRHKVCGEYISNESRSFLKDLGLDVDQMSLPEIDTFRLTTHHQTIAECQLNPGGFGLSRFALDHKLAEIARAAGATVLEGVKVAQVLGSFDKGFQVTTTKDGSFRARLVIAAQGRQALPNRDAEAWIGVKYHLEAGPETNVIEIHAFPGGYAGVSQIENGQYCLAYLCKAEGLKQHQSDIETHEQGVLAKNHRLAERLSAKRIHGPVTTSQFYFGVNAKQVTHPNIGDHAGFIPPLTGNGMSLALRSAKHLHQHIPSLLEGKISEKQFFEAQADYMKGYLNKRVKQGVLLQKLMFLEPPWLNKMMMQSFTLVPVGLKFMTRLAVGKTI